MPFPKDSGIKLLNRPVLLPFTSLSCLSSCGGAALHLESCYLALQVAQPVSLQVPGAGAGDQGCCVVDHIGGQGLGNRVLLAFTF